MTDDGTIRPALTQEDWNAAIYRGDFEYFVATEELSAHGKAALSLYGQPFGFTEQDAKDCEEGIWGIGVGHNEFCISADNCDCYETIGRLRTLAARIRALLPPETTP